MIRFQKLTTNIRIISIYKLDYNSLIFSVTFNNGEKLSLTMNIELENETRYLINYNETIWYAQD